MSKRLPRGIRNNNPGNIEWGDQWQGLRPVNERQDSRFAEFTSPVYGIRALARVLITYQDLRKARDGSRIDTVREVIERWAPAHENDVDAYTNVVRRAVFGSPDAPEQFLDMHDYDQIRPLVEAIIRHENGKGPLKTANTWYDKETITEGLRMAGVRHESTSKVPVTKETIGASAAATVGVAQIAEVLPTVTSAMDSADSHISSGSVVRIVFGLITIGVAAFIAYSQVKKHNTGAI